MTHIGQGNLDIHKCYRAMTTVGEMMTDRGYDIPSTLIKNTFEDFVAAYVTDDVPMVNNNNTNHNAKTRVVRRDRMTLPCKKRSDDTNTNNNENEKMAIVFFIPTTDLTAANLKEYISEAQVNHYSLLIFVTPGKLSATAAKSIEIQNKTEGASFANTIFVKIQHFEEDDLAVNITRHNFVPKHILLTPEQVKEVLTALALEVRQLPRLFSTDPVARYLGAARGDVLRIERPSESAGMYVSYRQVV
ncbi:RNA polymerase Rpb5, N-terminal domain/RNA polymerase Rpb5, C-terminal domain containing protein, putative [Angomonas deanei]|uniref:RNA polymerase Rpb5, N-terminal domain/RNA polymerase Rpb5, C-terminal domain containing protein, putative n=1 Tax=Angomonas deanei TaxID=59799 RepID=A0A7G2CR48_9TRYP|nr:RNA polymerase Rpb5, N-terminal domain/RNA polymerase Rpb5, C-terminal domain containing protein, putative [Angomonas deanei]